MLPLLILNGWDSLATGLCSCLTNKSSTPLIAVVQWCLLFLLLVFDLGSFLTATKLIFSWSYLSWPQSFALRVAVGCSEPIVSDVPQKHYCVFTHSDSTCSISLFNKVSDDAQLPRFGLKHFLCDFGVSILFVQFNGKKVQQAEGDKE